jgi:hypothetical protein
MALSDRLALKLRKKYEPSSLVYLKFGRLDAAVKTDGDGNAVVLFLGKKKADGSIAGERYARTLKSDSKGIIIKDHWERKGKAS